MKGNASLATVQEFRLALVHHLVWRLRDAGKIQLQKLVYFLQESFGMPTGYVFRMYHYGPYSEDLDTDMTRLKLTGYLEITPDAQGYGFHVTPVDTPERAWADRVSPYKAKIERVVNSFEGRQASELELAATIHFVDHLLGRPPKDRLIRHVRSLKPRFEESSIRQWHSRLISEGLLTNDG